MGDENTILGAAEARHLLRRTGFGAPRTQVEKILGRGDTRGTAVDRLLHFKPSSFQPAGRSIDQRRDSWIKRMLATRNPIEEKLVLFWHDHFATGVSKVGDAERMGAQNRLLRRSGRGNFRDLLRAINLDPAMMDFLDTVRNGKRQPNENYGRELCELFALGVLDASGNETYEQADVVQIARAFTGWRLRKGKPVFDEGQHDYAKNHPERGPKVLFTARGGFGPGGRSFAAAGEGAIEIDTVVDILLANRDSDGESTVARRIARRLLEYFGHGAFADTTPETMAVVDDVIARSGFAVNWEITPLLREILVCDAFYETATPAPHGPGAPRSVKWPVDFVITALRTLQMKPKGKYAVVAGGNQRSVRDHLSRMGQDLFDPPSVFGWDWETAWINSATALARASFARDLVAARGRNGNSFRPGKLVDTGLRSPAEILDATLDALDAADLATATQRDILLAYLTDGGRRSSLDLEDDDLAYRKIGGLVSLILQSPAYQLQ